MLIDLHTHSLPWSDDSKLELPDLVEQSKKAGLDGICLTEHDWFRDREELAELSRKHDILLLPGVEINTEEGHFLVFGITKYSFGIWHVAELKRLVNEAGGVMILAHPHRRQLRRHEDIKTAVERYSQDPIFETVKIIEVFNGRCTDRQNEFATELCRRLNLKGTGGSDAHSTSQIPSYATSFERKISTVEELIAELKAGRYQPVILKPGKGKEEKD